MTLFDDIYAERAAPLLREVFARRLRYYPADGGPPRIVRGIMSRPQSPLFVVEGDEYLRENVTITVSRNPDDDGERTSDDTDTDPIPGGIDTPRIGDAIEDVESGDGRRYAFTGEIVTGTGGCFTLGFERAAVRVTGSTNSRK